MFKYFAEPELVLTICGHTQMMPFGCVAFTVGMIFHDKMAWVLEDIEHLEWDLKILDELFEKKLL